MTCSDNQQRKMLQRKTKDGWRQSVPSISVIPDGSREHFPTLNTFLFFSPIYLYKMCDTVCHDHLCKLAAVQVYCVASQVQVFLLVRKVTNMPSYEITNTRMLFNNIFYLLNLTVMYP